VILYHLTTSSKQGEPSAVTPLDGLMGRLGSKWSPLPTDLSRGSLICFASYFTTGASLHCCNSSLFLHTNQYFPGHFFCDTHSVNLQAPRLLRLWFPAQPGSGQGPL